MNKQKLYLVIAFNYDSYDIGPAFPTRELAELEVTARNNQQRAKYGIPLNRINFNNATDRWSVEEIELLSQ